MSDARSFRSDIQGLRALAVGLVILAHAGFRTASGGFIGVDVFFVISGFLIIGLLIREARETRRISILDFYARRARRVIPAATVVLVATAIASAWVLPLVRGTEVVKDAIWAAFFGANIRFSLVGTDYFAQGEPESPVQHYWSLSVEEQFYIVIPVLLLLIAWVVRRSARAADDEARARMLRRGIVGTLVVVSAASLLWSVHTTATSPTGAYFSTATRAWELGLGGLAATILWGKPLRIGRWATEAMFLLGLTMVAIATVSFTPQTPVPGSAALLPVVGTALMLVAGGTASASVTYLFRLLSIKPARVVGDWSYSLYLWHFPVLRLCEEYWGEARLSKPHLAVALVAIFALGAASYHFVEQPFRKGVRWRPTARAVALYPASLAMVVATAVGAHAWIDNQLDANEKNPGITVSDYADEHLSGDPAVALVQASVQAALEDRPIPGGLRPDLGALRESIAPLGDCDYRSGTTKLCPFGDPDAERSIVVVGDSHGRHWGPTLDEIGKAHGYVVYQFVYSECPANAVTRQNPEGGGDWSACADFKEWALGEIKRLRPAFVVVSNNAYKGDYIRPRQVEGLRDYLATVKADADRVVVIGHTPRLPRSPGACLSTRGQRLGDCVFAPDRVVEQIEDQFRTTTEALGLTYVDAKPWFCVQDDCAPVVGRTLPLRDKEHVSLEYARELAEPLARAMGIVR